MQEKKQTQEQKLYQEEIKQQLRRHQQKQLQKKHFKQEIFNKINYSWEFRYFRIKQQINYSKKKNQVQRQMEFELRLMFLQGQFKKRAKQIFIEIICESFLPNKLKKYQYLQNDYLSRLKQNNQQIYMVDNIIFKISKSTFSYKQYKSVNYQFLSNQILTNISNQYNFQNNVSQQIHLPLCCFLKFRGFKALCFTNSVISQQSLLMGRSNLNYIYDKNFQPMLKKISQSINLKPIHPLPIYLSTTLQIHSFDLLSYQNFKQYLKSQCWLSVNKEKIKKNLSLYYLVNVGIIFPRKFKQEGWIRPQFMINWQNGFGDLSDNYNIANATQTIKNYEINQLDKKIQQLQVMPVDSQSISKIFHKHGINIRYIGILAKKSHLTFIKQIFIIEMIARTAKHMFFQQLVHSYTEKFARSFSKKFNQKQVNQEQIQKFKNQVEQQIISYGLDFFNLMFGGQKESQYFYLNVLYPAVKQYFNYEMKDFPPMVTYGGLFLAVSYNTGIQMNIKNKTIAFFSDTIPFQNKKQLIHSWRMGSKDFRFNNLDLMKNSRMYENSKIYNLKLARNQINILIKAIQGKTFFQTNLPGQNQLSILYAQKADILYTLSQFQQSQYFAKKALQNILHNHIDRIKPYCTLIKLNSVNNQLNKSQQYFDKANYCLQFHLGSRHILHISLYNTLAKCFTDIDIEKSLFLYQNSLVICKNILGMTHKTTGVLLKQIATAFIKIGKSKDALSYLKQAQNIYLVYMQSEIGDLYIEIAKAELVFGRSKVAMEYCNKAAKLVNDYSKKIICWKLCVQGSEKSLYSEQGLRALQNIQKSLIHVQQDERKQLLKYVIINTINNVLYNLKYKQTYILYQLKVGLKNQLTFEEEPSLSLLIKRIEEEQCLQILLKNQLSTIINNLKPYTKEKNFFFSPKSIIHSREKLLLKSINDYQYILNIIGNEKSEFLLSTKTNQKCLQSFQINY